MSFFLFYTVPTVNIQTHLPFINSWKKVPCRFSMLKMQTKIKLSLLIMGKMRNSYYDVPQGMRGGGSAGRIHSCILLAQCLSVRHLSNSREESDAIGDFHVCIHKYGHR